MGKKIVLSAVLIAKYICKSNIEVAGRAFTSFAIFAVNGVTAARQTLARQSIEADPPASRSIGLI